ncbi:hypothetical protein OAS39_07970 [Pirellulales bacterium]|nr:hypothetical protein [Pirellulales bacterium]
MTTDTATSNVTSQSHDNQAQTKTPPVKKFHRSHAGYSLDVALWANANQFGNTEYSCQESVSYRDDKTGKWHQLKSTPVKNGTLLALNHLRLTADEWVQEQEAAQREKRREESAQHESTPGYGDPQVLNAGQNEPPF